MLTPDNIHFFGRADEGGQRHEGRVFFGQRLLQRAVVVERDWIACPADALRLILELPENPDFRLTRPWRAVRVDANEHSLGWVRYECNKVKSWRRRIVKRAKSCSTPISRARYRSNTAVTCVAADRVRRGRPMSSSPRYGARVQTEKTE